MRLSETSKRIDALLERAGLTITGGTPLFRYATGAEAAGVFERLGHAGILVRHFPERPNWLRFGLPADDAAFERLAVALLD
jgi:cobalamin biosynthetic protein CobC